MPQPPGSDWVARGRARRVPPSRYRFDPGHLEPGEECLGRGADLESSTLLAAYRAGVFPMGGDPLHPELIDWWSPDPRGVLVPSDLRVSRSMRRAARRFVTTVDTAFDEVVVACADPRRPGAWITQPIRQAYLALHRLGWAHSIECWVDGELVGGRYGVAIGGLFAGESMFHQATDASKVALMALVEILMADGRPGRLIDVQWQTDHLATLGVIEIDRAEYTDRLAQALTVDEAVWAMPSGR